MWSWHLDFLSETATVASARMSVNPGYFHRLYHLDHPKLVHIGGLSHFLSPGSDGARAGEEETPKWARFPGMRARLEVARYTAAVLRAGSEHQSSPPWPPGLDPPLRVRLELVRAKVTDLVARYRDW